MTKKSPVNIKKVIISSSIIFTICFIGSFLIRYYKEDLITLKNRVITKYNKTRDLLDTSNIGNISQQINSFSKECENDKSILFHCYQSNILTTDQVIDKLTKEEKVKQILAPGFTYDQLTDPAYAYTDTKNYGAYILLQTTKYENKETVATDVKELSAEQIIPPLIGIDAEGGSIMRFTWYDFIYLQEWKNKSEKEIRERTDEDVKILQEMGINWVLSPVVDYPRSTNDWIYNRSISLDQNEIIKASYYYIDQMSANNIISTAKHFPGHGGTIVDSHQDVPIVNLSLKEWKASDGEIYAALIKEKVPTIMIGHLNYPQITNDVSSSSPKWITNILIEEMKYEGLVVTDDLAMLHPADSKECAQFATESLEAGADIIAYAEGWKCINSKLVNYLVEDLDEKMLDEKVSKVLEFKKVKIINN